MADIGASGDAASDQAPADTASLRYELARRRYDAFAASVLSATARATVARARAMALGRVLGPLGARSRAIAVRIAPPATARRRAAKRAAGFALRARRGGPAAVSPQLRRYRQYYAHTRPSPSALKSRVAELAYLETHPTVTVVVAEHRGDLAATLATLRSQSYDRTEVVIAARSASSLGTRGDAKVVASLGSLEDRINAAVKDASGEYVVVLLAGDLAEPHMVFDLVTAVQDGQDAAYGDEDRVDEAQEHVAWHLKPSSLGKETLLSYDVVGAPLMVRTSLFAKLGGLRASCAPASFHDFSLRMADETTAIAHVGEVLLSRPVGSEPDPADATAATIPVVTEALRRRGATATVASGEVLPSVRYVVDTPTPAPSVTLVIPTRDRLDLLRACVDSVTARTTYPNYSILICDNDSKEPATLAWLAASGHEVVRCPGPFNYSKIVNRGVAHTASEFIVTLNNDTTVATPDWLERLVGLCSLDGVGSVGVKLAYPDGRLQHEGVGIIPMPVHLSRDANYLERDRWLTSTRNATAVTGACQIVRAEVWRALGGLDEEIAVGYNDVDFAMRMVQSGWRVVYTPEVTLGHRESASRKNLHPIDDVLCVVARWDLLGDYVDPSMPQAMRYVAGAVELAMPSAADRSRAPSPRQDVAQSPADAHAALEAALAAVPAAPRGSEIARRIARSSRALLDDDAPATARRRAAKRAAGFALRARRGGPAAVSPQLRRYRQYYAHTRPSPSALKSRVAELAYLETHPTVTVVVAEHRGDLAATLATLRSQSYDRTEVVIAARSASSLGTRGDAKVVASLGSLEDRINAAVKDASGEYVVVLLAGDLAEPHMVFDLVTAVQDGQDAAYGDEDRVDEAQEHVAWHLKPSSLGKETLLSYDVVGAPLMVRTSLFAKLGGLRASCAPASFHDFSLRMADETTAIAHVGEVLLSRPVGSEPDPADATAATIPVVTEALRRRGATATVASGEVLPSVRYVVDTPTPAPSVTLVIPTRDRLDLLRACVDSVTARTTYPNYSILICDNDSKEPATLAWLAASGHEVVRCPGPFNYSKIVNRGVAHTASEFIVTLNNDTTVATPDWLERLVGLCSLDGVGSVGVKLAYPDGRLQHEGVGIIPMPVHLSRDANYLERDRWLTSTRNATAVTGACQIVRAEVWRALGGLDERLEVAFNDVDFAMRMVQSGWRVVYTPEVTLGHRESASRGDLHPPADEELLIARWDLLGDYVDPSMPQAMRLLTTRIELVRTTRSSSS